jgi:hypothetical protein
VEAHVKIKLVGSLVVFAALLAVCAPAFAHHGSAAYDASHATTLKNVMVTKVLWGNPHTLLLFDATDDKGTVTPSRRQERWRIGTGSDVGTVWNASKPQEGVSPVSRRGVGYPHSATAKDTLERCCEERTRRESESAVVYGLCE